jgi:lipopolysaccharide assembly outer membrane protein LptD (OstA)
LNNSRKSYPQFIQNQLVLFQRALILCVIFCTPFLAFSQIEIPDVSDTTGVTFVDSIGQDSVGFHVSNHQSSLEDQVEYTADDSIVMDLKEKKAYLYGNAQIFFQDIKLNAEYIVVDFDQKDVFAAGIIDDSSQAYVGRPEFNDDGKVYEADTMRYNFETKKGISFGVLTTEDDGYIHGERILRDSLENIYVKNAKFTTCNLPDPHFYIKADKIKVVPKKQIVTGPANLVIEDISTPLFVPFGFFPIPEKRKHGILFPTFGESAERGFNLRGLGYYIPVSDYFDVQVAGDFYFRGSWGVSVRSNYYKKYKYRGNVTFSYNLNEFNEPESPSYKVSNDYKFGWQFSRDSKAKPGSNFSANVNFVTSNFLKNNTTNYQDIISTTSVSSVSYGKSFFKNKLNIGLNSNMNQNLSTGDLDLTLPQLTANVTRQLPFKKFNSSNKTLRSFLRNLGFSYSGTFRNEITTKDTLLISGIGEVFGKTPRPTLDILSSDFRNGVSHSIPISTSFKAFKWVTVSPRFDFKEYWYLKTTEKTWDSAGDSLITDHNIGGFERGFNYNTSIGFSTILYGIKNFKSGKLRAIRHVARPNISAVWSPDFNQGEENGYRTYTDSSLVVHSYSIYEKSLLGRPSGGPQALLNFGLGNNLEIKVKSKKDTANGGIKKVKIIESMNVGSGYNFLADSLRLRNFSIRGNTTILNKIRMTFSTTLDPYTYDSTGGVAVKTNEFLWNSSRKLGQLTNSTISISTNLNPQAFKKKTSDNVNDEELEYINNNINNYIDFNLPWSLSLNYNLNARTPALQEAHISQSITFNGDIKLSENWKFGMSSGFDITRKELAFTSLDFYRNLHCWEMDFRWYPIQRQMFEFSIRVKSSTLQELKLNRKRSWWDL